MLHGAASTLRDICMPQQPLDFFINGTPGLAYEGRVLESQTPPTRHNRLSWEAVWRQPSCRVGAALLRTQQRAKPVAGETEESGTATQLKRPLVAATRPTRQTLVCRRTPPTCSGWCKPCRDLIPMGHGRESLGIVTNYPIMKVTHVSIFLTDSERVRAFAYIILDEQLVVNDIMIVQAREGLFVMMPVRRKRNGEFKEVACATTNEARREIEEAVFRAYAEAIAAREKESRTSARDAVSGSRG